MDHGSIYHSFLSSSSSSLSVEIPIVLIILLNIWGGGGILSHASIKSFLFLQVFLREWAVGVSVPMLSVDYSLAPEARYPRPLEEVLTVYSWVLNNMELLGTTGKKIVLTGEFTYKKS